jgi:hypothetical protein
MASEQYHHLETGVTPLLCLGHFSAIPSVASHTFLPQQLQLHQKFSISFMFYTKGFRHANIPD